MRRADVSHPVDNSDVRAGGKAAFRRRQTEEGEGDIGNGGNNKHIHRRVQGLRRADTGDGRRRRSQRKSDNDGDDDEGRSHPTPGTKAMCKLAAILCSAGILYALEASSSNVDEANDGDDNERWTTQR